MDAILQLFAESRLAFVTFALLVGLCVGSFLNVVIYRLPLMMFRGWREEARDILVLPQDPDDRAGAMTLATPPSACTQCSRPIEPWQNIPVLSYLWLRGRCACGKSPISLRYPAVELMTGLLTAWVAWHFGPTLFTLAAFVFLWVLVAAAWIDADTTLLPDTLTLPLLWLGLWVALLGWGPVDLRSAVLGATGGYLVLWSVYWGFKLATGKEGMGYGDFKLLAALGAWSGWQSLFAIILMAAVAGSVVGGIGLALKKRGRDFQMPFGPYLAIAGFVALLYGPSMTKALLGTTF
jgi:leader peptidase (prepilin peptidase) / N-methyltransferase